MSKFAPTLLSILLTAVSAAASAAPMAYSINSDSPTGNADSLYRIDLATGAETRIATVKSFGETRIDVEGLAIAPDGTLYGVDDDSLTLFPLSPTNAVVQTANEVPIIGIPNRGGNDFGMTFACDGTLFVTSVAENKLYRLDLDGTATAVGGLGVNISAIAAYGNPAKLYGLGNGTFSDGTVDAPNLYEINPATGQAIVIGALGGNAGAYAEGGLAFDDSGQLWAITDRRQLGLPSQVMKIDTSTGTASDVRNTTEQGFESLAITVPRGCSDVGGGPSAVFVVQKQYLDDNDVTPVTLNIQCNTGLPLQQSATVLPNAGPLGEFEVAFTVTSFTDGQLNCEVWESDLAGYDPTYECFSEGACSATADRCRFTGVNAGQDSLCAVRNTPEPVTVAVTKEWIQSREGLEIDRLAEISLYCTGLVDGDGEWSPGGLMHWNWSFTGDNATQQASVVPRSDGSTKCRTEEILFSSAVETEASCADWTRIPLGAGRVDCSVSNAIFFEGIPTLDRLGLALAALLLLATGMFAVRRF